MPLQDGLRCRVGLLQVDAPIAEFLQWDGNAGHRATHERSRPHDAKITVEVFNLGLSGHGGRSISAIEQTGSSAGASDPRVPRTLQDNHSRSGKPSAAPKVWRGARSAGAAGLTAMPVTRVAPMTAAPATISLNDVAGSGLARCSRREGRSRGRVGNSGDRHKGRGHDRRRKHHPNHACSPAPIRLSPFEQYGWLTWVPPRCSFSGD